MKRMVWAAAMLQIASYAADISYSAKPETEPIVVASGNEAETLGVRALRDQIFHWTFDDAENPLVDVVSGVSLAPANFTLSSTNTANSSRTAETVKMGEGAMKMNGNSVLGLRPVPPALQGGAPFTIMGWFHLGTLAEKPNNAFFYMGDCDISTNKASVRCLLSNVKDKFAFGATSSAGLAIESAESRWMHVALVYTPASGSVAAKLQLHSDGESGTYTYANRPSENETTAGISLTDETDVFLIGGAKYQVSGRFLGKDNVVDDVRVFSRALTADEVAWFRENTRPFEFSAEWRVDAGGTLDLYGLSNQVVNGYGTVSTDVALTLAPTNDAYFGGTLSGGGLSVAAANAVTQTLSGVGAYSGKTVLASGTTVFRPPERLPAALADNLIGHWTFDDPLNPGRDLSGYGNNLFAATNVLFDTIPSEVAGGGRSLDFSLTDITDKQWVVQTDSNPIGLVKANDYGCAVTMAVWAKIRLPLGTKRTGLAAFKDSCSFGMSVENQSNAKVVTFGGRDVGGATGCTIADSDNDVTNTVHLFVATFDPLLMVTDEKASAGTFYFDGVKKGVWGQNVDSSKITNNRWVGRGRFGLGYGVYATTGNINAIYDQAMLFNRALSAEEVAALHQFGQHGTPTAATGVLPAATELEIGAAAKAVFENANETVAGLSGGGALELAASARLAVTDTFAFTGTVQGAGRLVLGESLSFVMPHAGEGTFSIVTAPAGVLQLPASLDAWTAEGVPAKAVTVFRLVADAQAGTETLVATVFKRGFIVIVK